jgi:hypothetical protein
MLSSPSLVYGKEERQDGSKNLSQSKSADNYNGKELMTERLLDEEEDIKIIIPPVSQNPFKIADKLRTSMHHVVDTSPCYTLKPLIQSHSIAPIEFKDDDRFIFESPEIMMDLVKNFKNEPLSGDRILFKSRISKAPKPQNSPNVTQSFKKNVINDGPGNEDLNMTKVEPKESSNDLNLIDMKHLKSLFNDNSHVSPANDNRRTKIPAQPNENLLSLNSKDYKNKIGNSNIKAKITLTEHSPKIQMPQEEFNYAIENRAEVKSRWDGFLLVNEFPAAQPPLKNNGGFNISKDVPKNTHSNNDISPEQLPDIIVEPSFSVSQLVRRNEELVSTTINQTPQFQYLKDIKYRPAFATNMFETSKILEKISSKKTGQNHADFFKRFDSKSGNDLYPPADGLKNESDDILKDDVNVADQPRLFSVSELISKNETFFSLSSSSAVEKLEKSRMHKEVDFNIESKSREKDIAIPMLNPPPPFLNQVHLDVTYNCNISRP